MKMTVLSILLALPLAAQAPAPKAPVPAPAAEPAVGAAMDGTYQWVPMQFIGAAEAMPEDKFDWAPSQGEFKGVKTFAQQIKHVSAVNFAMGAMILGEKPPAEVGDMEMGPDSLKTKAEIVKYMKDSFAYARKAIQSITAQNGSRPIKNPFGQGPDFTAIGMATLLAFHGMDHYGQMVEYLRMNGIVPPASRPRPKS
ncbi:MAG: DinB family protein [Geothrix sp.]|uniref:DinB family protein n=1 Tax=Geothrix sp. TaxID=1962974 RepID=UPI001817D05E|nr:DinB family protein [Geothrix sp.]NWJ40374.1 DinB family protein [Geothrix sp.]WIL21621.1 MAG: DinB family protein [Geothrix sp.]